MKNAVPLGVEIQTEILDVVESSLHQNAFIQPTLLGVLPYMSCVGMCGPKGYGFSAVLVINRVSI